MLVLIGGLMYSDWAGINENNKDAKGESKN